MQQWKTAFSGLSVNTFLLALASLFADVSTEMLYPVLPIFLTQTLGASAGVVGLVEGVAQASQYVVQGFSGWLSDKMQRHKAIALVGYAVAALSKPLMGLSTHWGELLGARALDRLGTGTRSAPRDAMIAASAEEKSRGKAFGLEGIGDNLGACLGPLITMGLLAWLAMELSSIFLLAFIPGVLAALMILLVRDKPMRVASEAKLELHVEGFPKQYWLYLAATALFGVGNSSNQFLILRAKGEATPLPEIILVYAMFNLVAALASYPAGHLSDRIGRKRMLMISFLIFLVVYLGFALTTDTLILGVLFICYGVFEAIFRAVGKALATDLVPPDRRATGVGWYTATIGVSGLVANIAAGQLWTHLGPAATFLLGAATALVGTIGLMVFVRADHSGPARGN